MKKRLFQIFDEMNVNDRKNKTALLPCAFTLVEAKTAKGGGHVTMGVEAYIIQKIFLGEMQPVLVMMDKKEYYRLEALPANDELQSALARAERAEKALKDIARQSKIDEMDANDVDGDICEGYDAIINVARNALTPKQGSDE